MGLVLIERDSRDLYPFSACEYTTEDGDVHQKKRDSPDCDGSDLAPVFRHTASKVQEINF